jgi:hypothetical protein
MEARKTSSAAGCRAAKVSAVGDWKKKGTGTFSCRLPVGIGPTLGFSVDIVELYSFWTPGQRALGRERGGKSD